jgi:hypothetical protein
MGDKDQEKSEELEKQFNQEAKDAKSNGMIVGYACVRHTPTSLSTKSMC